MNDRSSFLFAWSSFSTGVARTLDIYAQLESFNLSRTPEEADALALYNDWAAIGEDLACSASQVQKSESETSEMQQLELALAE